MTPMFLKSWLQPCNCVYWHTHTICVLVCMRTHRCMCVTVWQGQMMHILSKDSLFSLNQCFQSGHYHFTISSIIINNSAFFCKVFSHAPTNRHSHTHKYTHTVYLVYWILSFPGLRCDLVYSLILIIPCVCLMGLLSLISCDTRRHLSSFLFEYLLRMNWWWSIINNYYSILPLISLSLLTMDAMK